MRSDIVPGGIFPDYALPDHTGTVRTLSELQGGDPLILTLARGHYCPKEHQQHLELAAFQSKVAVAYTQIVTISTDEHHSYRSSARRSARSGPSSSDPGRIVQKDLDIQEYTDPEHDPMIPHTLVLKPGTGHPQRLQRLLVLGSPVGGRPVARPPRGDQRDPARLGSQQAGAARGVGRGRPLALPRLGPAIPRASRRRRRPGLTTPAIKPS